MNQSAALGWREWVALPELNVDRIKVKVDTGARTSAIHTYFTEVFYEGETKRVRFGLQPLQNDTETQVVCTADVVDERQVKDSGGHTQKRLVIQTPVIIGQQQHNIEITLTQRNKMTFRMLLGRTAIEGRYLVDPAASYLAGTPS